MAHVVSHSGMVGVFVHTSNLALLVAALKTLGGASDGSQAEAAGGAATAGGQRNISSGNGGGGSGGSSGSSGGGGGGGGDGVGDGVGGGGHGVRFVVVWGADTLGSGEQQVRSVWEWSQSNVWKSVQSMVWEPFGHCVGQLGSCAGHWGNVSLGACVSLIVSWRPAQQGAELQTLNPKP